MKDWRTYAIIILACWVAVLTFRKPSVIQTECIDRDFRRVLYAVGCGYGHGPSGCAIGVDIDEEFQTNAIPWAITKNERVSELGKRLALRAKMLSRKFVDDGFRIDSFCGVEFGTKLDLVQYPTFGYVTIKLKKPFRLFKELDACVTKTEHRICCISLSANMSGYTKDAIRDEHKKLLSILKEKYGIDEFVDDRAARKGRYDFRCYVDGENSDRPTLCLKIFDLKVEEDDRLAAERLKKSIDIPAGKDAEVL